MAGVIVPMSEHPGSIPVWKRFEATPFYQRNKLFLKRLVGRELWLQAEIDVTVASAGGWCFHQDVLQPGSIVYSLGIGKDIEFDRDLIERCGVEIHALDPTPSTVDWIARQTLPPSLHFHPWAVSACDGALRFYPRVRRDGSLSEVMYSTLPDDAAVDAAIEVPSYSFRTLVSMLGHRHIDLLKMDIEGAEYEVLDGMLGTDIRPRQLLIEFHHRLPGVGVRRTAETLKRLRGAGYRLFAVSGTGREVSLLRE